MTSMLSSTLSPIRVTFDRVAVRLKQFREESCTKVAGNIPTRGGSLGTFRPCRCALQRIVLALRKNHWLLIEGQETARQKSKRQIGRIVRENLGNSRARDIKLSCKFSTRNALLLKHLSKSRLSLRNEKFLTEFIRFDDLDKEIAHFLITT